MRNTSDKMHINQIQTTLIINQLKHKAVLNH